jgi:2-methylaconitate cis-trans-isomerase PrpF
MRGGTSKAVIFRREDLPPDMTEWDPLFLAVMGSPDSNGRQLDGMGGGLSSLSKVCVVGPPSRSDADVDYTFAQISVKDASVDYSGNCGNMSSAIGPFAVEESLCAAPRTGEAAVRIHNTNTNKIIISRFALVDGSAETEGDMAIDGVAGTAAPIRLEFMDPGGAKSGRLLPTGRTREILDVPGVGMIEVSMVDAANPCVFVDARSIGKIGVELPDALEADRKCLETLEAIRCAASVAMGIAPTRERAAEIRTIPLVAIVSPPHISSTLSGRLLNADDMSIGIRMISSGQPHRAVPVTGATCLAIAARITGTIPNRLASASPGAITIAHPSGLVVVDAAVTNADDPERARADFGAVYRTARRLFDGRVYYRPMKGRVPASVLHAAAE